MVAAGLLALGVSANATAQPVRQVLVLQSLDRGNRVTDGFTGNFRVELDQRAEKPVNVIQVVVGATGFARASEQAVVDYIRSTFVDGPTPDLIMTVGGPSALFARKYRQQLFPDTPLLFAAIDQRYLGDAPLRGNETAVTVDAQYPRAIDAILELLPLTKQVFMVMGSGQIGQFWRRELEKLFSRFDDRLTFVWLDDLSFPEILRRCASLPSNSAIFYFTFGTDVSGAAYADDRAFADLHAVANAPLFAAHSVYLGQGVVGGALLPIEDISRDTADVAVRLLNGVPPGSITVAARTPGLPIFDWRELQRWAVPESRLPPRSVVLFRAPSLWQQYRRTALSVLGVVAVQSLLIVGLLYQRSARQRAETESRRNLSMASDANRRAVTSALTGSIAHELSQPLNSMLHNAQAAEILVASNRATPELLKEMLADICSENLRASAIIERHRTMLQNRQMDKAPLDVHSVVHDTLDLVRHDLSTRQIRVDVSTPPHPCLVLGDRVLLQQVLVNLMVNAGDAMGQTPRERRQINVRSQVGRDRVSISVRDAGTGLPSTLDGRLFEPFATTKTHGIGIGLTIARTIVEAHNGNIDGRNNPEGGATFIVTLPCLAMS